MSVQADRAPTTLTIGELATRADCPVETIRFYERSGYLPPAPRSGSGRRIYGDVHVERLRFIRRARELGFSLARARALLELSAHPEKTCAEAMAIAQAHLAEVRQRRAELERLEIALERLLAGGDEGIVPGGSGAQPLGGRTEEQRQQKVVPPSVV